MSIKVEVFAKEQLDYITENLFFKSSIDFQNKFNYDPTEFRLRVQMVIDSGQFISEEYKGMLLRDILRIERVKLMQQYGEYKTLKELSEMIGVTEYQTRKIAKEHKIKISDVFKKNADIATFSDEDTQFIKDNFIRMSAKELANELTGYNTDQLIYKIKSMIANGSFGELNKNKSMTTVRENLRVLILKDFDDNIYHIEDVKKMFDCSQNTAYKLAGLANLKFRRKIMHVEDSKIAVEQFYDIPTDEIDINALTYEEWFRRWFHTYRDTGIREVTRLNYYITWAKMKDSSLGRMLLKNINRNHVQAYANEYGLNRSKSTVLDHMQLIRSAFKDAHLDGHVKVNPAGNIRIAYKEQKLSMQEQKALRDKKMWLEVDEYEKLKNYLVSRLNDILNLPPIHARDGKRAKATGGLLQTHIVLILTALKTGARYGEIVGLTRDDIITQSPYKINIDKTWDHKKLEGHGFAPTKNVSSIREVVVDEETILILRKYMNWIDEYKLPSQENTLFNLVGRNLYNTDVNKTLATVLKELNIARISMHKLRHTMASYLIAKGVDLMVVAKRLGHTDSSMVLKVYGHLLEETENKNNDKILQLL